MDNKKIATLLIFFLVIFLAGYNPIFSQSTCLACQGSNLVFEVESGDTHYSFLVHVLEKSNQKISFEWLMTLQEENQGQVIMTKEAIESGEKIFSFYEKGATSTLTNANALWISKDIFRQIKTGKPLKLNPGNAEAIFQLDLSHNGTSQIKVLHSKYGRKVEVPTILVQGQNGKYMYIIDDEENPLIIKMDVGYIVTLEAMF